VVLGVDVGGTKVAVAAVDGVTVRDSIERPTVLGSTAALLDGLEEAVRLMIGRVGQPSAIGAGVPSQLEYATGTVETSVNIPLTGVPLRAELGRRFGVPVVVDNDANCAALGEAHILGEDNLVMLTLGTGVGGGVVIGGKTFRGAHGLGAELGHFTLNADGPPCPGNCPNRGCIEAYCSGQALERDATEMAADRPDSRLAASIGADGRVSGHELVRVAESGDPDALLIFENFARMLGIALAGYVNVFEPDRLALGGGLSRASDLFLDRALREAQARALPALWRRTTIELSQGGADAGVIGAAVLAAQERDGQPEAPGLAGRARKSDTAEPHAPATERAE
jgi:glucokinase